MKILFTYLTFIIKIYFVLAIIGLLILNYFNPQKWQQIILYPSENGLLFYYENLLIGFCAGFSTAVMAYLRNQSLNNIFLYYIATFVILISINVLFQYSGIYNMFYRNIEFDNSEMMYISINGSIFIILLIILIISFWYSYKKIYISAFFNKNIGKRIIEIIIFMIAYTVPFLWVDKNRTQKINYLDIEETIYFMIGFLLLFLVLEFSGFFTGIGLQLCK
jgi:hypothetical protein